MVFVLYGSSNGTSLSFVAVSSPPEFCSVDVVTTLMTCFGFMMNMISLLDSSAIFIYRIHYLLLLLL